MEDPELYKELLKIKMHFEVRRCGGIRHFKRFGINRRYVVCWLSQWFWAAALTSGFGGRGLGTPGDCFILLCEELKGACPTSSSLASPQ